MKQIRWIVLILVVALSLIPYPVNAAPLTDDQVVMGGSFVLKSDQTLNGNLIIIGGTARIEENAVINGSIILLGGQVTVNGIVESNLHLFAGSASISDSAIVLGDVFLVSSVLNKSDSADIRGEIKEGGPLPSGFVIPDKPSKITPAKPVIPSGDGIFGKIAEFMASLLSVFFFSIVSACVAMLIALFAPRHINRVSNAIVASPWIGFLVAILTLIAFPMIVIILAISIILSPVAILSIVALALACYLGSVALGTGLGDRITRIFRPTWAVPVSAGMGTLIMGLVLGVISLIPCIGWLVVSLIVIIGLGGVILTRFGTRIYENSQHQSSASQSQ